MKYYIGWDVGGWNCSKKSESQDAVAVLTDVESKLALNGTVFRGQIRAEINGYTTLHEIVNKVCGTRIEGDDEITIAIDTPLGLPLSVQSLVTGDDIPTCVPEDFTRNPYLYRCTEQWLFTQNFPPLSAVKDMIGSQATKGMHLLRKLKLVATECGVWRSVNVTAIECYPTTCKRSENDGYISAGSSVAQSLFASIAGAGNLARVDQTDAVFCALIAYLFATDRTKLYPPQNAPPITEGWIWIPRDAQGRVAKES